ncbi:hypothetical protein BJ957_1462 [Microcella putealis]|nr:hypothetical protein BJ957_1462 [Microcella putealis]
MGTHCRGTRNPSPFGTSRAVSRRLARRWSAVNYDIKFKRILGVASFEPRVLAIVDDYRVTWKPSPSWRCDCGDHQPGKPCGHVAAVRALVHPDVTDFD